MTPQELRAAILALKDAKIDPVPTPEWPTLDGLIFVRSMSAYQREMYLDSVRRVADPVRTEGVDPANVQMPVVKVLVETARFQLAAATMCDSEGTILFTPDDVNALCERSFVPMERIIEVSAKLNGLSSKAREAAKNDSPGGTT